MHKVTKHLQHYLPLFAILSAGFLGFSYFSYDPTFRIVIVMAVAASYVSWGIIHHFLHKDLHASIVLEYLAIASLGTTVLAFLILKS